MTTYYREPVVTVHGSDAPRVVRVPCPRCGVVNCTQHSAGVLTTRAVPAQWRAGA